MTTAMRSGEAVPFGEKAVSQGWRVLHRSGILVPAAFLAGMARFAPLADTREFDTDEGVNLIKALLVGRGHALYTEIWDDQPPLLTAALAHWFNWFGSSVLAARVLVLLFAALLLWAFYQAVRRTVTE